MSEACKSSCMIEDISRALFFSFFKQEQQTLNALFLSISQPPRFVLPAVATQASHPSILSHFAATNASSYFSFCCSPINCKLYPWVSFDHSSEHVRFLETGKSSPLGIRYFVPSRMIIPCYPVQLLIKQFFGRTTCSRTSSSHLFDVMFLEDVLRL